MKNKATERQSSRGYLINTFDHYTESGTYKKKWIIQQKNIFMLCAKKRVPDYTITESNKQTMNDLFLYFLGIEGNLDLNKGIFMYGYFGAGKSLFFSIIKDYLKVFSYKSTEFTHCPNQFITTSIEEISVKANLEDLLKSNIVYNDRLNDFDVLIRKPKHILVNEFGKDYKNKNFGTSSSESVDIFLKKRYDIFQEYKKLTHVTSNFSKEEIADFFAPEIVDRFNEMFNFVTLKGQSFRK